METGIVCADDLDRSQGDETDAPVRAFLIADVRGYTSFTQPPALVR